MDLDGKRRKEWDACCVYRLNPVKHRCNVMGWSIRSSHNGSNPIHVCFSPSQLPPPYPIHTHNVLKNMWHSLLWSPIHRACPAKVQRVHCDWLNSDHVLTERLVRFPSGRTILSSSNRLWKLNLVAFSDYWIGKRYHFFLHLFFPKER